MFPSSDRTHGSYRDHEFRDRTSVQDGDDLTSTMEALTTFLRGYCDMGIFAMPLAFKAAGLRFGLIATICGGIICTHTSNTLVRVAQDICYKYKHLALGYSETVHSVFEYGPEQFKKIDKWFCLLVDYGLFARHFGVVTVYIVFISTTIRELFLRNFEYDLDVRLYILIIFIPLLCMTQLRYLRYIHFVSMIGTILFLISFAISLYYIMIGNLNPRLRYMDPRSFTGFFNFFGIILFSMMGIGTIMPIENRMRKPRELAGSCGIINWAMLFITFCNILFGYFGYVQYGDDINVIVVLNVPEEISAIIAQVSLILSVYFSISIQIYIPIQKLRRANGEKLSDSSSKTQQIVMRLTVTICCVVIALVVPNLECMISLIGYIFNATLSLFVPPFLEIIYLWGHASGWLKYYHLIKNTLLIIFFIFGFLIGTVVVLLDIVNLYRDHK